MDQTLKCGLACVLVGRCRSTRNPLSAHNADFRMAPLASADRHHGSETGLHEVCVPDPPVAGLQPLPELEVHRFQMWPNEIEVSGGKGCENAITVRGDRVHWRALSARLSGIDQGAALLESRCLPSRASINPRKSAANVMIDR